MADIYYGNREFRDSVQRAGRMGNRAEDEGLRRTLEFDPSERFREFSQGAFADFRKQYGRQLRRLQGRNAGMGRTFTGFGQGDEDHLFGDMASDLNNRIAQGALQTAGMQQANNASLLGYGQNQSNAYMDALAGLTISRAQQEAMDKASRRQMWGNLVGGLLGASGSIIGGMARGGTGWFAPSDERLKEDVEPIEGALEQVRHIPGVRWDWNEMGEAMTGQAGPQAGVLTQDVEMAAPEAAVEMPGGVKGVDYTRLVGILAQAVRELDAEIQALKGERGKPKRAGRPSREASSAARS